MNMDGHKSKDKLRNIWMDCVKEDTCMKGICTEMTADRSEWKKETCFADPRQRGDGTRRRIRFLI